MVVVKRKIENQDKKDNGQKQKRQVKYVYLSSRKAVFLVVGEPKESKYSVGIPIIPLHGYYKSDGKSYTAKELSDYFVILNVNKNDGIIPHAKKGVLVIIGYRDEDIVQAYYDEEEGDKNADKSQKK